MDYDLKLVTIENTYIEFLQRYQKDILPNRKEYSRHNRLYLSIKLYDDNIYCVPLCSPKESDFFHGKPRKNFLAIIRLLDKKGELLSTLRPSHMIVAPINALRYYTISDEKDYQYKSLVYKEYLAIKKNKARILKNCNTLLKQKLQEDEHYLYTNQELPGYLAKTIDFAFISKMSLEYAPGLELPSNKVENNDVDNDDLNFVMLDKHVTRMEDHFVHDEEKTFDIEEEMMNLRMMVQEKEEPVKPVFTPKAPEVKKVSNEEEVKSSKAMLLIIKSILSGNSDVELIINSKFKYKDDTYQVLQYDYKSLYALIRNCKTGDITLVSNFPKDEECGWEKPIKFGNQSDSYARGLKIYNGFIK